MCMCDLIESSRNVAWNLHLLMQAEKQLEEVFRSCNKYQSPLSKLAKELRSAKKVGLSSDDSRVCKSVERFLDSMEKTKRVVLGKMGLGGEKITYKILDIGGQKVCRYTRMLM